MAFRDGDNAESTIAGTISAATGDLVDAVNRRINLAGQAIAPVPFADNLDTKIRHHIAEGGRWLQIDRVPSDLHEGLTSMIGVGTCHVRGPVTIGVR